VRRLFSNFASGFSGLGLLIRIAAGTSLIVDGAAALHSGWPGLPLIFGALEVGGGAMLAGGVWTPIAGFVAVTATISQILLHHENPYAGTLLSAMAAGLALVGPGAFSVDAWLFGLKKIDIEKLGGPPHR
jgi:putative oxidoreductase